MSLSEAEKNGLQVYRNYRKAFEAHAEKAFAKELDDEKFDLRPLEQVGKHIASEDVRFLPVIACAYADDQLNNMFKAELAKGGPSGRKEFFGPFGPVSNLFNRIQLAYAFEMLSQDLMLDLDKIRQARNDLSHTWDISLLSDFFTKGPVTEVFPIDTLLSERQDWFPSARKSLEPLLVFRIRLIWILARLTYEAGCYARAKKRRLNPVQALYGQHHPKRLADIANIAGEESRRIISPQSPASHT